MCTTREPQGDIMDWPKPERTAFYVAVRTLENSLSTSTDDPYVINGFLFDPMALDPATGGNTGRYADRFFEEARTARMTAINFKGAIDALVHALNSDYGAERGIDIIGCACELTIPAANVTRMMDELERDPLKYISGDADPATL